MPNLLAVIALLSGLLAANVARAETATVAVATNFMSAAKVLVKAFEAQSGHQIILAFGSTGKHYAQIIHGAPFHLLLAADHQRPLLLQQNGHVIDGSRFSYALGQLVLWCPKLQINAALTVIDVAEQLTGDRVTRLAVANPRLAPYGLAAKQFMMSQAVYHRLTTKLVTGENIGQTFRFVDSGNAECGLVAYSQLITQGGSNLDSGWWLVPESLYQPIEQQVVLLSDHSAATEFWQFLRSDRARQIIHRFGYKHTK